MNRSTTIRRGVAATVAAAGLAVGGIGIASAADDDQSSTTSSESSDSAGNSTAASGDRRGPGGHGRGGHGHRGGHGDLSSVAEALDVTEEELQSAHRAVREAREPSDRSSRPTDAEREQRQEELATALSEELDGVSAAQVTAAFDEVKAAHQSEKRSELGERLSGAVTAGDLTANDRQSVLKAFDAGVLGSGR